MSVFDNLTHDTLTSGTEGITVHITNGDGFAWGETIQGIVTLAATAGSAPFARITVSVIEQDEDGFVTPVAFAGARESTGGLGLGEITPMDAFPSEVILRETVIATDVTLAPGETKELPFQIGVPIGVPLTAGCFVAAHAAAVSGLDADRHAATPFVLIMPRYLLAVRDALMTFGDFEPVEVQDAPLLDGAHGYKFTLDYAAPETLREYLDGVKFELEEHGDTISGVVEINPQEHTLVDHLRAFIHQDRIQVPVAFDRAELEAAGQAGVPSEATVHRLHELLNPFLHPVVA